MDYFTALDYGTGESTTMYALWRRQGRGYIVVDTDRNLDALAERNGIDKVQVVEIKNGGKP